MLDEGRDIIMKRFIALLLAASMTVGLTVGVAANDTIILDDTNKSAEPTPTPTPEPTATPTPEPTPAAGSSADTAVQSNSAVVVTSNKTYLALGSDLTADQRSTVLALMG